MYRTNNSRLFFTTKAPLSLSRPSTIKVQDMVDDGLLCLDSVPAGIFSPTPPMEEFAFSVEGILELLKNLKPGKAAGPDKLKPLLLQALREEIAPILQIISERSLQIGELPAGWCRALVTPVFKKGGQIIGFKLQTDLPHLHTV